ncbi:response regulator [Moritella viscosa]|uniref:Response regulatory domain-containing protein n=1 Tax=Moritella viscosa TaxID=80854 RepID=A0ABY1HC93_9GAMM|nr:response regulator [Moritella viscosa]SGY84649.1 Putative uncharacterized protein [Moritella viscosa]
MNILIVDDQKFVREAIKSDLVETRFEHDFQMFEAEDANQGIETIVATEGNIDLLILDLKMNNSDGMEVINFLSVHPCYSNIPLAVLALRINGLLG